MTIANFLTNYKSTKIIDISQKKKQIFSVDRKKKKQE